MYASHDQWRRVMLVLSCRHLLVVDGFDKVYDAEYEECDCAPKSDLAVLVKRRSREETDAYQHAC